MADQRKTLDRAFHDQRQRLLKDQDSINDMEEGLGNAMTTATNTATLGKDALTELKRQHEELKGAQDGIGRIGDNVKKANRLTFMMILREWKIRIILMIVLLIQLLFILVMLYFRWVNPTLKCLPDSIKPFLTLCWGSFGRKHGHCECMSWP
ncbi:hypothetical protein J8273_0416 [Carpediemonas membranifera]|uniref:Uncharacterized protein n=1 Tax=Carpediemonas membranifera TaxID=201153 RepID=A0A8J6BZ51_9EUKA|nr:hypothetical protein J8273_0416 [Carpediemonas membranifera]|eukprot:KAG9395196.1 hypothetical protein J8273_0416 [Carpediemonas membranifera]